MAAHEQWYLTCSYCGTLALDESSKVLFGETDMCVRDEAKDLGWKTDVGAEGVNEALDFCPKCVELGVYHRLLEGKGWEEPDE